MVDISERLIPYKDEKDLASRVASLFDWEQIGDSLPREFSTNPKLPQGVILSYPRESFAFSYNPLGELCDLVRYFPPESDIVKEIIKQGEENLKEILSDDQIQVVSGWQNCGKALIDFQASDTVRLLDILFCDGGCIMGGGITSSLNLEERRRRVTQYWVLGKTINKPSC